MRRATTPRLPFRVLLAASLALLGAHAAETEAEASAAVAPEPLTEPLALRDGDSLHYRIAWGIFPKAGEIKIFAETVPATDDAAGGAAPTASAAAEDAANTAAPPAPFLQITTTTGTRSTLKKLFRFYAEAHAIFDTRTWLLQRSTEESSSKRKQTRQHLSFDYASGLAHYINDERPEKTRTLALPPGQPMDLITCLVQTRAWDLRPGQSRDALVIFEDDFYELTIHATGYEDLSTPLGKFRTLVLEPRMEKTPPKGMFRRGSTVKVWISQDAARLPVRFQVEFKFGSGTATLVSYHLSEAEE